jgi:hypothetical protein
VREYPKIDTMFKRDMTHPKKVLLAGEWTNETFAYLADNQWQFTEKVDGTNIRVNYSNTVIEFGGRTDNASLPAPLVKRLEERFFPQRAAMAEAFPDGVTLYGEGYGAKIQSGGLYRADQDFVLFDVRIGDFWLRRGDVEGVAAKLGLDVVPIIGTGTLHSAVALTRAGIKSQWGDFTAEGIVARPVVELQDRAGHRVITKIKHRDFA